MDRSIKETPHEAAWNLKYSSLLFLFNFGMAGSFVLIGEGARDGAWKLKRGREQVCARQGHGQGKTAEQLLLRPLWKPHGKNVWGIYLLPAKSPVLYWIHLLETQRSWCMTGLSPVECPQERLSELLTLPSSGGRSNKTADFFPFLVYLSPTTWKWNAKK